MTSTSSGGDRRSTSSIGAKLLRKRRTFADRSKGNGKKSSLADSSTGNKNMSPSLSSGSSSRPRPAGRAALEPIEGNLLPSLDVGTNIDNGIDSKRARDELRADANNSDDAALGGLITPTNASIDSSSRAPPSSAPAYSSSSSLSRRKGKSIGHDDDADDHDNIVSGKSTSSSSAITLTTPETTASATSTKTATSKSKILVASSKNASKATGRRGGSHHHPHRHHHHHAHNDTSSNKHASFFSPPRIVREPIPFLSPTTPIYKDFVGTDDVRLLRNPRLTIQYFCQGLAQCAMRNLSWPRVLTTNITSAIIIVMGLVWAVFQAVLNGSFDSLYSSHYCMDGTTNACTLPRQLPSQYAAWLFSATLEAAFWFGCGVLSTAGLGSGVQTGALILFPHVCKLAVEWSDVQNDTGGSSSGGSNGSDTTPTMTFTELMWLVAIPGFWSGTGSAVGEMLPFVLARMIKAAGGDPFALLEEPDVPDPRSLDFDDADGATSNKKKKSWTSVLVANTRSAMEGQMLESYAFLKIFVLATVPNGLFDLCGLVCGSAGIPFWTFFGAVWSGKALVRTPLQTCTVATAVALFSTSGDGVVENDDDATFSLSSIQSMVLRMGRNAASNLVRGDADDGGASATSTNGSATSSPSAASTIVGGLKMAWTAVTFSLLGFFLLSTIEQVAQHHAKTVRGKSRERKKRRMRC